MKSHWIWMSAALIGCVEKADDDENQRCNFDDVICTIAGKDSAGYNHQNQDALDTKLDDPNALAFDSYGRLLINDSRNQLVRRLEDDGILTTIVGRKEKTYAQPGHPLSSPLNVVVDMAIGPDGNLYMVESQGQQVLMVDMVYEELSIIAGSPGSVEGFNEGDVAIEDVNFSGLSGIVVSGNGTIYLSDAGEDVNLVRAITPDGMVMTIAGEDENGFPIIDQSNPNRLLNPQKLGLHNGQLYVTDTGRHRIVTVDVATGELTNVAGQTDAAGYQGDGGPLHRVALDSPYAFAFGPDGRMLIADSGNDAIRAVMIDATVDTVVGRGSSGFSGDEGPAEEASIDTPRDIMYAPDGSLIIADSYNARIRRVNEPGW